MILKHCFSALGLVSAIALSGPAMADDSPIKVGFAIAKTGWMSAYDQAPLRAAMIAIDEINANGGLLGRQIETTVIDTKTDLAEGAKAAQILVDKNADLIVVTCDYDNGAPAALAAQNAGKISISLCAQDPKMGVQGVGDLSFTASSAAQVQGAAIGEWAYEKKGIRNVIVLLDNFIDYNKSVCAGFDAAWDSYGDTNVVGRDVFKNSDPSIATQITNIRNMNPQPDAIVICSLPPGGASALRQIRQAGIEMPILGTQAFDGSYWLDTVPGLSDFYLTVVDVLTGDEVRPEVASLVATYEERYAALPATSTFLDGYGLIEMWSHAVREADTTDARPVVDEMEKMVDFPTIKGPVTFTSDWHIQRKARYLIAEIQNGEVKPIEYWTSKTELSNDVLFLLK